ncbi:hypothetical protein EMMF5_002220 [Cystobasidiomycetes sp. EMM_F5]
MLRRNWGQGNDLMSRVRDLMEYEVHTRDGARRGYPAFVSRDECKTLIFFIDRVQELVNYLLRSRSSRPSAYEIRDHAAALDFPDWRRYLRQIELPLYADDDDRHILRLRGGLPASDTLLDGIQAGTASHRPCRDEQNCLACLFSSYALGTVGVDNGGFDFITLREEIATRVIRDRFSPGQEHDAADAMRTAQDVLMFSLQPPPRGSQFTIDQEIDIGEYMAWPVQGQNTSCFRRHTDGQWYLEYQDENRRRVSQQEVLEYADTARRRLGYTRAVVRPTLVCYERIIENAPPPGVANAVASSGITRHSSAGDRRDGMGTYVRQSKKGKQ